MDTPFLGFFLIIKDGEKTLPALLEDIKDAAEEFVFVFDTSTTDSTAAILREFATYQSTRQDVKVRTVFAPFQWINDFSAARNYCFSLGSTKWRCWLDADDRFKGAPQLTKMLQRTEKEHPTLNCISIPYQYSADLLQDKHRIVRWADGWLWTDPIHEYLIRTPGTDGERRISKYVDLVVEHDKSEEASVTSLKRNIEICTAVFNASVEKGDKEKQGLMAYYLGLYALANYKLLNNEKEEDLQKAASLFVLSTELHPSTNITAYCFIELVKIALEQKQFKQAIDFAAKAFAVAPEMPDGLMYLAYATALAGESTRAALLFTQTETSPRTATRVIIDQRFEKVLFPYQAAMTFVAIGDYGTAAKWQHKLDSTFVFANYPEYVKQIQDLNTTLMRALAARRLKDYVDVLLWDTESIKAIEFLKTSVPASIADQPFVAELRRSIEKMVPQLKGWEEYKATYESIPAEVYHSATHLTEFIQNLPRTKGICKWARKLAKEGADVTVCSVGFQDGIIEAELLKENPRLKLTVTDVAPQAGQGVKFLSDQFPDRISYIPMGNGDYDWPNAQFDAVLFFEVLEHVRSDEAALLKLRSMLKPDGILFLSTPVAAAWVEEYLTTKPPPFYGHVRAHNPQTLIATLRRCGLAGEMWETRDNTFFCQLKQIPIDAARQSNRVAIYVPNTPHPFDYESVKEGHLGGSEEAVVYLSRELAAYAEITIYSPPRKRADQAYCLVDPYGVRWRPVSEFDAGGAEHDVVMFWRTPNVLLDRRVSGPYKKWLLLHDCSYGATKEAYEKADKIILLSKAHKAILKQEDGYAGDNIALATNGIVAADFDITEASEAKRDPHKVIWGSSPDRGLATLLDMWPDVLAATPQATLDIYYSWDMFEAKLLEEATALRQKIKSLGPSVSLKGGVSHPVLHEAYKTAAVWAYSQNFFEISCISAVKSAASGCWPIYFDYGAVPETLERRGDCIPAEDTETFKQTLIQKLKTGINPAKRLELSQWAREKYDWKKVAARFIELI